MQKKTHDMLDVIVTFQDDADLEPTHKLFSRFLPLGTYTGLPRTHRTPKVSIRKRLFRRRKETNVPRKDIPVKAKGITLGTIKATL